MMIRVLSVAINEEQIRRQRSLEEFRELFNVVSGYLARLSAFELGVLRQKVSENLIHDLALIKKINLYISSELKYKPPPIGILEQFARELKKISHDLRISDPPDNIITESLKSNKMQEIFMCAYSVIAQNSLITNWDALQTKYPLNSNSKTFLKGTGSDLKGTSTLNCLQVAMFTTLYTYKNVSSILEITEFYHHGIYSLQSSPLIHTTALPTKIQKEDKLYSEVQNWIYFYKDFMSPMQGELMFFHLGFALRGSTEDSRYIYSKELKPEDASSAVAKWVGSPLAYTTQYMKQLYYNKCSYLDIFCRAALHTLAPLNGDFSAVKPGMIYMFANGGHTGVVTEKINSTCFESLSYARNVPKVEGLGYDIDCITKRDYLFFVPILGVQDNNEL